MPKTISDRVGTLIQRLEKLSVLHEDDVTSYTTSGESCCVQIFLSNSPHARDFPSALNTIHTCFQEEFTLLLYDVDIELPTDTESRGIFSCRIKIIDFFCGWSGVR